MIGVFILGAAAICACAGYFVYTKKSRSNKDEMPECVGTKEAEIDSVKICDEPGVEGDIAL